MMGRWTSFVARRSVLLVLGGLLTPLLLPAGEPSGIRSVLQPFVERQELSGAVTLVATQDKVLSLEAVGYADIAAKRPMKTDSLFWIASMSKPIMSTALMLLVHEGKVRLDDPITRYLPQFVPRIMVVTRDKAQVRLQQPEHVITVRHLLTHTSGLVFASSVETPTHDLIPMATQVQSYSLEHLKFEPGSDYSYSNAGINAAARIVEVVSSMSIEDFLQRRLFDPLGMKDPTFWPHAAQVERLARAYKANAAGTGLEETPITQLSYPLTDRARRFPLPGAGLFSTASDMGRFCQMILSGGTFEGKRYLSKAAIREMTRNQLTGQALDHFRDSQELPASRGLIRYDGMGLGWATLGPTQFGHNGAYSTGMNIDLEQGSIMVWMVQHAGFPGKGNQSRAAFEKAAVEAYFP